MQTVKINTLLTSLVQQLLVLPPRLTVSLVIALMLFFLADEFQVLVCIRIAHFILSITISALGIGGSHTFDVFLVGAGALSVLPGDHVAEGHLLHLLSGEHATAALFVVEVGFDVAHQPCN